MLFEAQLAQLRFFVADRRRTTLVQFRYRNCTRGKRYVQAGALGANFTENL